MLVCSIAMYTDHNYHGEPIETTTIELHVNPDFVTPEQIELLKEIQVKRLHAAAKAMPHKYWQHPETRPYVAIGAARKEKT